MGATNVPARTDEDNCLLYQQKTTSGIFCYIKFIPTNISSINRGKKNIPTICDQCKHLNSKYLIYLLKLILFYLKSALKCSVYSHRMIYNFSICLCLGTMVQNSLPKQSPGRRHLLSAAGEETAGSLWRGAQSMQRLEGKGREGWGRRMEGSLGKEEWHRLTSLLSPWEDCPDTTTHGEWGEK